ncbi:hypothetical protein DTO027B5_4855 [Paecilomyces variotii]|nr:hypothetical protein DTO027B3_9020 [Paecilomyces variotii]KAJ9333295.1 hypothetical protein DTO027B5_4855 [Paecilomyces variotii]
MAEAYNNKMRMDWLPIVFKRCGVPGAFPCLIRWCGVEGIIMRIRISINSYPSPETSSCWRRIHTSELLRIDRLHADVVKAVRKERLILQPSTLLSMNRIAIRDVRSTPPP